MATNNNQFQENVYATIQDFQTQIGQLATTMNQLQSKGDTPKALQEMLKGFFSNVLYGTPNLSGPIEISSPKKVRAQKGQETRQEGPSTWP
ncbi:hypothetical protein CR513_29149, partial [Mucuna pruriens]